jgi:hypothetical protein
VKKLTVFLVALATAAVPGAGIALAQGHDDGRANDAPAASDVHVFSGTVVSVDAAAGTVTADIQRPDRRGRGPGDDNPNRGPSGASGPSGATGPSGVSGPSGPTGVSGASGPSGQQGPGRDDHGDRGPGRDDRPGEDQHGDRNDSFASAASEKGHGDSAHTQRVTFKTDTDTSIFRNRKAAALADLLPTDAIQVVIVTENDATDAQALAEPAFLISAKAKRAKPAFFGFAGQVTSVNGNNITLSVKRATKSARRLLGANASETFTTNDDTRAVVDGGRGQLSDLKAGDDAAIGIRAPKGSTLEQVLATPAKVVLGLSDTGATTSSLGRMAGRAARVAKARR